MKNKESKQLASASSLKNVKLKKLERILKKLESVVVAYSGGVDSSFLLKVASLVLDKDNVLAVTARSQTYTGAEYRQAVKLARDFGVRHISIRSNELNIKKFRENSLNRCYYCKRELFSRLKKVAQREKLRFVLDGTTFDDLKDFRPGMRAAKELGVCSPLKEAGMTKDDIRRFSRSLSLVTWDKPAQACLASRFPYRNKISKEKLRQVEKAETLLRKFGFNEIRVRHYGKCGRIEVGKSEIGKFFSNGLRQKITAGFKGLGFIYVTLDLEGYRSGSMNDVLRRKVERKEQGNRENKNPK